MSIGRSARRVLIVCTTATVCGAWIAGPAAAASTDSEDLLGLGGLVNSLTQPQPQQSAAAPNASTTSKSSLVDTLEDLPILGPVLKPVVESLPLLGSTKSATGSTPSAGSPSSVATVHQTTSSQLADPGSTWTAPRVVTPDPAPPAAKPSGDDPGPSVPDFVKKALTSSAASKAELGAAAIALIILGGVAVAGAAGAAGAAGRRQFIGGPW